MKQLTSILLVLASVVFPKALGVEQHAPAAPPLVASTVAGSVARKRVPRDADESSCGLPDEVVREDFARPRLNTHVWFRWSGQPGGDPYGWWRTPLSVAGHGTLNLRGTWVTSGGNPRWKHGGEVTSGSGRGARSSTGSTCGA